jgi:MOSC domain-containing protein YiiM
MSKVHEIGVSDNKGSQILKVSCVQVIKSKGILGDRKCKENNEKNAQITLIEIENITYYNKISNTKIKPLDFRRNIVTEGVRLNALVNEEFWIGSVKVKGHELCKPCKYLQKKLGNKNFVKEMFYKGGLRCEILTDGEINVFDKIIKNF